MADHILTDAEWMAMKRKVRRLEEENERLEKANDSLKTENAIIWENSRDLDEQRGDFAMKIEEQRREIKRLKAEQRPKAHWITKTCDALYCSNCDTPSICYQPFCCKCGAEMMKDGETDG